MTVTTVRWVLRAGAPPAGEAMQGCLRQADARLRKTEVDRWENEGGAARPSSPAGVTGRTAALRAHERADLAA